MKRREFVKAMGTLTVARLGYNARVAAGDAKRVPRRPLGKGDRGREPGPVNREYRGNPRQPDGSSGASKTREAARLVRHSSRPGGRSA